MSLADNFDGFLVDLDGVVWRGEQPIEGAADTIEKLREAGKRVVFLTNNASLSPREYAAKLMRHRIPTQPGDVISSAHAIVDYLKRELRLSRGDRVHVVGTTGLSQVLRGAGLQPTAERDDVHAVVVAWNPKLGFEEIRRAADLARAGLPLVGANRDATYPGSDGLLPGTGAILAAIETASGVRAHAVGKPAPELFRAALDHAGAAPERTLVLGDRLETDIAGAAAAGLPSALVLTGVTTTDDLDRSDIAPDWVLDRIDDLVREGVRRGRSAEPLVEESRLAPPTERNDQHEPRDEPAYVREDGDAAVLVRDVAVESGEDLPDEPEPDDEPRGRAQREEEEPERDEREHARARPEHDVRAEDSGDGAGRTDDGKGRVGVEGNEDERGGDAADEVEDQKTYTTESIFDVVPEDPEEEHIEPEVQDVRVHEHRGEYRSPGRPLSDDRGEFERVAMPDDVAWDESVPIDEWS
jgi:4-nitrophenyl phosphatase